MADSTSLGFDEIKNRCQKNWPNLTGARQLAAEKMIALAEIEQDVPENTALVVFGSLARGELTTKSDLDWALLVDGQADPFHFEALHQIGRRLVDLDLGKPGMTGTFGTLISSHQLVHQIGGFNDSNLNMTRRLLLILESTSAGNVVRPRVIRAVLQRYLHHDRGVLTPTADGDYRFVSRFLMNDIVRFWRTMAVDYAAKRWERDSKGWATRNLKLRMSRKLLFVSGLLLGFAARLHPPSDGPECFLGENGADLLLDFFFEKSEQTPIDSLASTLLVLDKIELATNLFEAYDEFLGMLSDEKTRQHLDSLAGAPGDDQTFSQVRRIGGRFQEGLDEFFFKSDSPLLPLIQDFGVF